jgi:hypothetical protein
LDPVIHTIIHVIILSYFLHTKRLFVARVLPGFIRFEDFKRQPAPPDVAKFKKLVEFWTIEVISELSDAPDDVKARFAELFDLYATIRPDSSRDGYHCDLTANIPLEMEGDKPSGYDMVFSPSGRGPGG